MSRVPLQIMMLLIYFGAIVGATLADRHETTELRMPGVTVEAPETYLCYAFPLDDTVEHWITGYEPHNSMEKAHHMLLFGCAYPGSDNEVWDCGEMKAAKSQLYERAPVCRGGSQSILYAWARDAPALELPKDVGFKVGGDSKIQYLILQIHYMHALPEPDHSGITIHSTDIPMPRSAAVMLLATNGMIRSHTTDNFDVACEIDDRRVALHPFAFRVHAHTRGKVVSGWKVSDDGSGHARWELIGKRDPMAPQMFYPVADEQMVIRTGDIVAARCHMTNNEDHDIYIGTTGVDEMCNFYMMYWTEGDNALDDNDCVSPGPPEYRWSTTAGLDNIPDKEASTV